MGVDMPDTSIYYSKPICDATKDFIMQQTVRRPPSRAGLSLLRHAWHS
jgi:hypothetical protein